MAERPTDQDLDVVLDRCRRWPKRLAVVLLVLTAALWAVLLVDACGLAYVFVYVLRFPNRAIGRWLGWSYFIVLPLIALLIGRRLQGDGSRRRGRCIAGVGGILFAVGVSFVVAVHSYEALRWRPPENPTRPRPTPPLVGLPVFPGAEGFGARTRAGRGGQLIPVTSLADSGPGTLRAALADPRPRIIVFRIGGTIELERELTVCHPYVTVAGQTAPGGGICLKNAGLVIATHDVLVQHLRIRPGNAGDVNPETNDAIQILGGPQDDTCNIVLDHVSASWGEDETVSTWFGAHDITISWSIISEALHRSRHPKRTHSAGLLIGDSSYHVSIHHCLLAHNGFRNPLVAGGGTHDFVNNVVYNWGEIAGEIADDGANSFLNFVGNRYLAGPSTGDLRHGLILHSSGKPRLFLDGNLGPTRSDAGADEWAMASWGWSGETPPAACRAEGRFATPAVTTWPAEDTLELVLAGAGATRPRRDATDLRVVEDTRHGRGAIIDSPAQVGGYPHLDRGESPADSDGDGMPDTWESAQGLDPRDPADAKLDRDGDGYTDIEEYLFSLL
ncbi:MAG: hypothetical protein MUF48_23765 [Pirellulaceae bacterium]|nr:hypothetical protein [Pirellulaceae bacterium]